MAQVRRCDPLRQQLDVVDQEILQIQNDLSDPDLPPAIKHRLRELLDKLQGLRPEVRRVLTQCEKTESGTPPA